jgi:hypothetical protein
MKKLVLIIITALICGFDFTNCSLDKPEQPDGNASNFDIPEQPDGNASSFDIPEQPDGNASNFDIPEQPDENITGIEGENGVALSLVGSKWKLEVFCYWDEEPINVDYSQYDIIYEFKGNNVLLVSGEMDSIDAYKGHTKGEHSYKIHPIPPSGPLGPCPSGHPIEIDTETHTISFGWVFFDFYEGNAMHMNIMAGELILVKVD